MRTVSSKLNTNVINHHQPSGLAGDISKLMKLMREADELENPGDITGDQADGFSEPDASMSEPGSEESSEDQFTLGYNQALDDAVKMVKEYKYMDPAYIDMLEKLKKPFGVTDKEGNI